MSNIRRQAQKIMGIEIGTPDSGADQFADNLAIALCSYFEDSSLRPDDDEEDGETWTPWVREQYHATEKSIVDFVAEIAAQECDARDVEIARLQALNAQMLGVLEAVVAFQIGDYERMMDAAADLVAIKRQARAAITATKPAVKESLTTVEGSESHG